MSNLPLVSVICLSYNHEAYVQESLKSISLQTYPNIECIIVDDASVDQTKACIEDFLQLGAFPFPFKKIFLETNLGNCKAFNLGLKLAAGKYIIDLAADDLMDAQRVSRQVHFFEQQSEKVAAIFHNVKHIDEEGEFLGYHYKVNPFINQQNKVRREQLIAPGGLVCTPALMFRKSILLDLGGYNEALSYEDYDFYLRASREHGFVYQDELLTLKRKVTYSHGGMFYSQFKSDHLESTLSILKDEMFFCLSSSEQRAWRTSLRYHARQAYFYTHPDLALRYFDLLKKHFKPTLIDHLFKIIYSYNFSLFRKLYSFKHEFLKYTKTIM